MGNNSSLDEGNTYNISDKEIEMLASSTNFSGEELCHIRYQFEKLSNSIVQDNRINFSEFRLALRHQSDAYAKRIFSAFNTSNSGYISFMEFISGLSHVCPRSSIAEKSAFVFKMFDTDMNQLIGRSELKDMILCSISNTNIKLNDEEMFKIVENTMQKFDTNNDGYISLDIFTKKAINNPSIVTSVIMTLDNLFPGIIDL